MQVLFRLVCLLALAAAGPAFPQQQPASAVTAQPAGDPLDLNTATMEQLRALPGMGKAYAVRVIAGRPYTAKNQLVTRGVIPQATYEKMQSMVVARHPRK